MNTDAIKHINLEFPYRDETRRFTITLNLEEYSHRSMWNHFNSGQLYEPETSQSFGNGFRFGRGVMRLFSI